MIRRRTSLGLAWLSLLVLAGLAVGIATSAGATDKAALPNGRAYEMVSPPDKNGGNIVDFDGRVASSGDKVAFGSPVGFGDAEGMNLRSNYIATRMASGWQTHGVLPRFFTPPSGGVSYSSLNDLSDDLSHARVSLPESSGLNAIPPLVPAAHTSCPPLPACTNTYLRDNADASYDLLTPGPGGDPSNTGRGFAVGGTPDFGHVLSESVGVHAPGALDNGHIKLYEWDHGVIRNVGIDPLGVPFSDEVAAGITERAIGANRRRSRPISEDGSRIYFTVAQTNDQPGQIYLRENAAQTYHVNQSEHSSPGESLPATFLAASFDGPPVPSRAFFASSEQLLNEDGNSTCDLYMYTHSADPTNDENLMLLSEDHEPSDGVDPDVSGSSGDRCLSVAAGLLGISEDGTRAYFTAKGQIVSGAPTGPETKLYLWDLNGGGPTVTYIAGLRSFVDQFVDPGDADNWVLNEGANGPGFRLKVQQVTPDGGHLVLLTSEQLLPTEDRDFVDDVYRYDAEAARLDCVSCQAPGALPGPAGLRDGNVDGFAKAPARVMSDDGSRVFFESPDALVPQDDNRRIDIYQWEEGQLDLISTGRSNSDTRLLGSSSSGDDVFFLTRERLVGWDVDNNIDLYDARVGGGFPEPVPAVDCGLTCQGPPSEPPADSSPGSQQFIGLGNSQAARSRPTFHVSAIGVGQRRALARRGRMRLTIRVPHAGRIVIRGAGMRGAPRNAGRIVKRVGAGGEKRIVFRLSRTARRYLKRNGRLRLRVVVGFGNAKKGVDLTLRSGK